MTRAHWLIVSCGLASAALGQGPSVVDSKHNLSASGPGTVRAVIEDEVCIFCHTPHNASPIRPLWNRAAPTDAYAIYTSRALDATPGQPTGTSKMCLSCHDGTIALGSVVSRTTPIVMSGGVGSLPQGNSNLGTSLADDHPISFRFDVALAGRDPKLKDPASLPEAVKLDTNGELQCTSCHDAHNNTFGNFLLVRNQSSELCLSCHQVGPTTIDAHANCSACHQPHTSPSGPYLLKRVNITDTCLSCHDGSVVGAQNISTDVARSSNHDTASPVDPTTPAIENASCVSCHDPHTMSQGAGTAPSIHPNFGRKAGVNLTGTNIVAASFEYEVCFACHADGQTRTPTIHRQIVQNNTRLQFSPSAASFHPVVAPGRNPDVPSLKQPWTTSSIVYCTSCHTSSAGVAASGTGPDGTHGSANFPLLIARYETADHTSESADAYALCYGCHDRANILGDRSFRHHKQHVVDQKTPCSACHDGHGIASTQGSPATNSHLINFDTAIVRPNTNGVMEFRDLGALSGTCSVSCHGKNHLTERY